jgi:hypothetical protein
VRRAKATHLRQTVAQQQCTEKEQGTEHEIVWRADRYAASAATT